MLLSIENTELVWVDQPQKLSEVARELSAQEILAVDTESNSLYAYKEQVCLLQFSTHEKDYLIDTLALADLSVLAPIFRSEKILKVFHAAEYDLICLFRDYGFAFNFLFDTMIAARTLGYQKIGLGALLERFFGIEMNKKYQRANWGKRPIKPDMRTYARLDSHYLIPLQGHLRTELVETGLWELALEDFQRLTHGIEDTTENHKADYWKLQGARDLSPENAAVLKSLYQFREAKAEAQNRPPFKVLSHQVLIELARTCPLEWNTLENLSGLNARAAKRYGKGLMQAIRDGLQSPPEYPPQCKRPNNALLDRIEALKLWRKVTGRKLGVPSDVILPRDVLTRIARANPTDLAALEFHMRDVPYRFHHFGQQIVNTLLKESRQG